MCIARSIGKIIGTHVCIGMLSKGCMATHCTRRQKLLACTVDSMEEVTALLSQLSMSFVYINMPSMVCCGTCCAVVYAG